MRKNKQTAKFLFLLLGLAVFSIFVRLFVIERDNLYFTVDQGRDAVFAREILRGRVFLKGPETNIRGIFAGPAVDYFISFGYFVTGGHPQGAMLVMAFANIIATASLVLWLRKKIGDFKSLLAGFLLQLYWPFFETSLWGFHPFPLVSLSILLLILLTEFITQKNNGQKYYYFALLTSLFAFNAEVAGAAGLYIFTLLIGFWGIKNRYIPAKKVLIFGIVIPGIFAFLIGGKFIFGLFSGTANSVNTDGLGRNAGRVFSGTSFTETAWEFGKMFASTTIPQNMILGFLAFMGVLSLFYKFRGSFHPKVKMFVYLSLFLGVVSYLFFATNQGYRSWHVVYLPPLMFISVFLTLLSVHTSEVDTLPKCAKTCLGGAILLMTLQFFNFKDHYLEYLKPNTNPSLLYNQLSVIDWVYLQSTSQGFRVYTYTDTFYDYPYQYLFWWYGLKKYNYLPDEYSNFPLSHKDLYIPGYEHYLGPSRSGVGLKYLIIESETNGEENKDWPKKFRKYHELIDKTRVGNVVVEKYVPINNAPSDICIWWGQCNDLEKNYIRH